MIIAIDGPAGSGKTTIAKRLSKKLNVSYLDTGATYRALTLKALEDGLDLNDELVLRNIAENLNLKISDERIYIDGKDVSAEIRTPFIDKNISVVVSHSEVRGVMVDLQRKIAKSADFVVEGRDITTVVFPQAEYKFFVDADFSVRARRRFKEVKEKGICINFEELSKDLHKRDEADKNREVGPLKISDDAIYIDTTDLSIDEVVDLLATRVKGEGSRGKEYK
jgi:cytidylate kinase